MFCSSSRGYLSNTFFVIVMSTDYASLFLVLHYETRLSSERAVKKWGDFLEEVRAFLASFIFLCKTYWKFGPKIKPRNS